MADRASHANVTRFPAIGKGGEGRDWESQSAEAVVPPPPDNTGKSGSNQQEPLVPLGYGDRLHRYAILSVGETVEWVEEREAPTGNGMGIMWERRVSDGWEFGPTPWRWTYWTPRAKDAEWYRRWCRQQGIEVRRA